MDKLVNKRGRVKASLTRIQSFLKTSKESGKDVALLEARQRALADIWHKYDEIQYMVEEMVENDTHLAVIQEEERASFEEQFFEVECRLSNLIKRMNGTEIHKQSEAEGQVNSSSISHSKLPPINIPKFNGDINGDIQWGY